MREQLGRDMRAVVSIARRCAGGRPAVVRTAPRLEDGTPFPTSLYLTLPWLTLELSRLEAGGIMAEFSDRLTAEEELAAGYLRAHERYLARREDRKSTRLNSSHVAISYAVFCLKKKKTTSHRGTATAQR